MSALFSVNKANLASFHESDHVEREGERIRAFADRLLDGAGIEPAGAHPAARLPPHLRLRLQPDLGLFRL